MTESQPIGPAVPKKTFVLCFDGTGNKFHGNETDSNILKIYRMLDRADGTTFTFYQPGIGTYVATSRISATKSMYAKIKSWYIKSKDAAIGSSFADHVMGGYLFLMRYYSAEDDLYFFGFSRGAYTARFLAEMLDHVGLLSAGNEVMATFAWKTYAKWASRPTGNTKREKEKELELYNFMRGFRETFSRQVRRIRFLGLFDTVNSVPAFENAWMQRTKFPYTARSSAKVIRHAVSIDERRAKFRQDLITGSKRKEDEPGAHHYNTDIGARIRAHHSGKAKAGESASIEAMNGTLIGSAAPSINITEPGDKVNIHELNAGHSVDHFADAPEHPSNLQIGSMGQDAPGLPGPMVSLSTEALGTTENVANGQNIGEQPARPRRPRRWSDTRKAQDIEEVWFPGCHGDIGGGWPRGNNEHRMLSHVPLTWMVREAERAGLKFDPYKMAGLNVCPDAIDENGERHVIQEATDYYHGEFHAAATEGKIHDSLLYGDGLGSVAVAAWKMMEYMPFRRMNLKSDGTWSPIRWPLPCGETRDVPNDAQIHISAITRMEHDAKYRPGNLIIGGGGRGTKTAPAKYGIGQWQIFKNDGDKIRQTYLRANDPTIEK